MEVMIAVAIFFMAIASVLQLMARGLKMARALQQDVPSPAFIASDLSQIAITNRLEDGGSLSGDFSFLSSKLYDGYTWDAQTYEVSSNGLFQADIIVTGQRENTVVERKMSILLFSPNSGNGGLGGPTAFNGPTFGR
jgi:hypothetical protein